LEQPSKTNAFPADALERLATRISAGDVVFFVGSGHSVDTEKNTASNMVRRLMARFEQMKNKRAYPDLYSNLLKTFELDAEAELTSRENIDKLAAQYYKINDWITNAFGELIPPGKNNDLRRGKKEFLDAQGFNSKEIMGGDPLADDILAVQTSYQGRLLARHFVLGRLAREGLSPTLITTNFDLQLEGGYRLAGLSYAENDAGGLPRSQYDHFVPITSFGDFLKLGARYHTAAIVKIHGCARMYRERKDSYLDSLVFTYREIQNWRKDAWSRDLLTTILRTRTVAFCGYSTADPVLHDTFRTVYEEIATHAPMRGKDTDAPAFFSGSATRNEFDAMEVLRAASRAAGVPEPPLADHPNYLRFFFRDQLAFPNFDEMMIWLWHRVIRLVQLQTLKRELGRVVTQLGIPWRESYWQQIEKDFIQLCASEMKSAMTWNKEAGRVQCQRITSWTWHFHAGLLREWAFGEAMARSVGFSIGRDQLRGTPWYFPFKGNGLWTAWAVVVELAFRKSAAAWRGKLGSWHNDSPWCMAGPGPDPVLLFSQGKGEPTPYALTFRSGNEQRNGSVDGRLVARKEVRFTLRPGEIWPRDKATAVWEIAANAQQAALELLVPELKEANESNAKTQHV